MCDAGKAADSNWRPATVGCSITTAPAQVRNRTACCSASCTGCWVDGCAGGALGTGASCYALLTVLCLAYTVRGACITWRLPRRGSPATFAGLSTWLTSVPRVRCWSCKQPECFLLEIPLAQTACCRRAATAAAAASQARQSPSHRQACPPQQACNHAKSHMIHLSCGRCSGWTAAAQPAARAAWTQAPAMSPAWGAPRPPRC
jgi:hypothetical protein